MPISIKIIFVHLLIGVSIDWTYAIHPLRSTTQSLTVPRSIQFKYLNCGGHDARAINAGDEYEFPPFDCAMPFVPIPETDEAPPNEAPSMSDSAVPTSTFKPPIVHPIRPPRIQPQVDEYDSDSDKHLMETQISRPLNEPTIDKTTSSTEHDGNSIRKKFTEF